MSAIIDMEHNAGTSIERACEDACRVANILGVGVKFDFNGVKCLAWPQGSAEHLAERWNEELTRKLRAPMDTRYAVTTPERAHEWFRTSATKATPEDRS